MRVGIDIGATWTRIGAVDSGGVLQTDRLRTAALGTAPRRFVDGVCDVIVSLRPVPPRTTGPVLPQSSAAPSPGSPVPSCLRASVPSCLPFDRIGIAVPGPVDRRRGAIVRSVNLPALNGFALGPAVAECLHCPVTLLTDAEAATWGEYTACEPRPATFVHLRLGSGVACGAVIDGVWAPLDEPRTTHAPTLIVDHSATARPCPCGLRGCLETIASGRALLEAEKEADRRDTETKAAAAVCVAMENLWGRYRPNLVTLGGGLLTHRPAILARITETCCRTGYPARVEQARLGDNAGVIGAAGVAGR